VATALAVAALATVLALRLFFQASQDTPQTDDALVSSDAGDDGQSPLAAVPEAGTADGQYLEADVADTADPAPDPIIVRLTLDRWESVQHVLRDGGLDRASARRWASQLERVARVRALSSGHLLSLYKDPETGELRGIRYDLDEHTAVVEWGYDNGVIIVAERPIDYFIRRMTVAFSIRDNFEREASRQGVPKPIIDALEQAFSDHNPLQKLPQGSSFKLVYDDQVSRDGTHKIVGEVEAAQVEVGEQIYRAFAFRDEHGRYHLYDDRGRELGPEFLRFPLAFKYISSGFSNARYHPILHRYRPHVGVDLVARYGTPVKAVADGRVEASSWAGELGNCVRIRHEHHIESIYGHLSRISPTARPGSYVRVGQVIGWVGSTGLSTGPHLHFALIRDGRYVNPLTQVLGENHQVSPRLRGLFDQIKKRYETILAQLPDFGHSGVLAMRRKPPISDVGELRRARLVRHRIRHQRHVFHAASSVGQEGESAL
jgi:murein DD-endopeptidase MepM/ murein hydrolase activator NlpD